MSLYFAPPLSIAAIRAGLGTPAGRMPTFTDNAAAGYVAGDVWQYNKRIWTTDGAGNWTEVTPGGAAGLSLPVDAFGAANVVTAFGVVPMASGYVGNAFQLLSGSSTLSYATGRQRIDETSLYRDIANSIAQTITPTVQQFTDQSGNGNHLIPVLGWKTPGVGQTRLGGQTSLSAGFSNGSCRLFSATGAVSSQNFCLILVGRTNNSGASAFTAADILFEIGNSAMNAGALTFYTFGSGSLALNSDTPGGTNTHFPKGLRSDLSVITIIGTASGITVMQNEEAMTFPGTSGALTITGLGLFGGGAFPNFSSNFVALAGMLAKTSGNAPALAAVRQYLYSVFDIRPQVREDVFVLGDSRTYGYLTFDGRVWPCVMADALAAQGRPVRIHNISTSGLTTQNALAAASNLAVLLASLNPAAMSTLYIALGTNSVSNVGNQTPAQAYADLLTIAQLAKAAGVKKVVLSCELPRSDNPTYSANVNALRQLILATNSPYVDRLIDFEQMPALATTSATWWADGNLHPNTAAHGLIGNFAAAQHLLFG